MQLKRFIIILKGTIITCDRNTEFGMRVYILFFSSKTEEDILLYTFLRISLRKINILKKTKLDLRKLNEIDDMNAKKILLNLTNILKPTIEMPKKK